MSRSGKNTACIDAPRTATKTVNVWSQPTHAVHSLQKKLKAEAELHFHDGQPQWFAIADRDSVAAEDLALGRHWVMSETDAQAFIRAAQARLDFQRSHAQISVDGTIWLVGFVRGAPCQLPSAA
jgi:hypothetical protein